MQTIQLTTAEFVAAAVILVLLLWGLSWLATRLVLTGSVGLLGTARRIGRQRYFAPWRTRLAARYPRLAGFLRRRFDTTRFVGLGLTLMAIAGLYIVFLFAGLIQELMEAEEIMVADREIFAFLAPYRAAPAVGFFRWITGAGDMVTLVAAAAITTGFLAAHGPRRYIVPVWITVLGSQLTTWIGKFVIYRPRPEFILDVTASSPSFPSAHATGAMAVYGIIGYVLARDLATRDARFHVAFWTGLVIAAIAFSRVFLNVHFASDVAAGLLVGLFWLLAGIVVGEITRAKALLGDADRPD